VAEDARVDYLAFGKPVKIPQHLGRYEVVDLIGQGGMGALYRARDPRIGRYVAIKLLRRSYDTPELRDRFSREARAAGSLSHPNIVTIYDVGEDDGLPFIAMEYVRGETFADLVCLRPPLSVARKLQLTEEVCAGLAHAHEAGIVHRDIKPANLIVGPEGTVKILDFGIAKLSTSGSTRPGAIMGTLNYMSPEQVKGTAVDARADIFSVGAVLYELLSHQQAFPGQVPEEVFQRILSGVPTPITEYCPEIDPRLVRVVDRLLQKDPDQRFQDIATVQKELASIRLSPLVAALPPPAPARTVSSDKQSRLITPPPAPAPASVPPTPADRDLAALRAQHIEEYLIAAERAFATGDYDAAIESCKHVLMLDASQERAISQIDRIHAAIDEQQARAHVAEAREQLSRGATTAAWQALESASLLSPSDPEIASARGEILAEEARRQEEQRIRAAVDDARRRFARGEHEAALQALAAFQPASSALVAGALEELRLAFREVEEQRRVEQERAERRRRIMVLLDDARTALGDHRFDEALRVLELVREIDATVPELADVTGQVHRAQAAARLEADLQRALGDFEERLAQGELPAAGDLLKAAVALAPADPRVQAARKRLEEATAALAAREAALARRREGEQKIEEAAAHLERGDLAGAADMLKLAAELIPQHPRAAELAARLQEAVARQAAAEAAERLRQQVAELIRSAAHRLQSADDKTSELVAALREVNQALALDPENAEAPGLKSAIEEAIAARREAARARAVISNARRRFENGKHHAALRLLEDFQPSSNPEVADTLAELRATLLEIEEQRRLERERVEKQQRVAALLAEARSAFQEQRFDAALALLSNAGEIDPAAPELSPLTERVRQGLAAARLSAELDKLVADLDGSVAQGDLSAATELLRAATAISPGDPRVQLVSRRIAQAKAAREAAEARARELDDKNAAAEALLDGGDLQGAMRLLEQAKNLDAQHPRTVLLLERAGNAVKEQEAAAAAERLRRTVDELLAAAAELLQSADRQDHDVTSAMQKITQALALAPGHAGAEALKATAEEALAPQREAARIRAAIRNARNRFAIGKHQAALQLLENLDPSSHPVVADTLKELRGALAQLEQQRAGGPRDKDGAGELTIASPQGREPRPPVEAVARPWRWGLIVGLSVLVIVILAALFRASRTAHGLAPREPVARPSARGGEPPLERSHRFVLPEGAVPRLQGRARAER
jgi:serine/threonine protein kinase